MVDMYGKFFSSSTHQLIFMYISYQYCRHVGLSGGVVFTLYRYTAHLPSGHSIERSISVALEVAQYANKV